jgi:hypothetical protein
MEKISSNFLATDSQILKKKISDLRICGYIKVTHVGISFSTFYNRTLLKRTNCPEEKYRK